MITIVITSPDYVEDEASKLTRLLDAGVDYIHIRKPAWTVREVKQLVDDIPYNYRKQLKLHGHFDLLNEVTLGGVHLNSRNPIAPKTTNRISRSCHSLEEVSACQDLEYVTLSPIFDSISKSGYKSKFNISSLIPYLSKYRVVALGGITTDSLPILSDAGFYGAALLGDIWQGNFDDNLLRLRNAIKSLNSKEV